MKKIVVPLLLIFYFLFSVHSSLAAPAPWSDPTAFAPANFCDLENVFSLAASAITALIGLASFISLINGGFKLVTSGGDAKAVEAAHKTITFALLGIILLVSSIFIFRFIQYFTGVNVLTFTINSRCP